MKPARDSSLRERLFTGMSPGLPPKTKYTPFGQDCSYKDEFGIVESQVNVVVTVLAAEAVGLGPVTQQQMDAVCAYSAHGVYMLERLGWIECSGKIPGTRSKLWRGTKKAWRVLGLAGWKVEGAA